LYLLEYVLEVDSVEGNTGKSYIFQRGGFSLYISFWQPAQFVRVESGSSVMVVAAVAAAAERDGEAYIYLVEQK
jgi:hypothetical protein